MHSSWPQLALSRFTMSSQQPTPSNSAIPASVARILTESGLQITPDLVVELSKAMVEGSAGPSANDNTATTATAGETTVATVAGDNGEVGASEQMVGPHPVARKQGKMKAVERERDVPGPTHRPAAIPTKLIGGVRHWLATPR